MKILLLKFLTLKSFVTKIASIVLFSLLIFSEAFAGWSVNGTQILDPNGQNFIFRGINHPHNWYPGRTNKAFSDIAATSANSVRVVLSNGTQWTRNNGADVGNVINQCKTNKLVCVLEVHDSTGFGDSAAATNISNATAYWTSSDIKTAIIGHEDYVIVNIANEPYGNKTSASTYTNETSAAIKAIRNAGITHLIMVDAPAWGQDWQFIMRDNAAAIFAADPLSNTMFSVHMYEVYNSSNAIQNYLTTFKAKGFALIVGEFGTENNGNNVDEASILQITQQMGIGYMGWSWSGNGGCCLPLDIVTNWNPSTLTTWGNFLINSAHGIKATSKLASHFDGASSNSSSSKISSSAKSMSSSSVNALNEQCNWYGTFYPLCANTNSGWGYENNKSCVARATCAAQPSPYGIVGNASSRSSTASSKSSSSIARSSVSSQSSSSAVNGIGCTYMISNAWSNGFTGTIRVTNTGTGAINGWNATWKYTGNNRLISSWSATVTGANPYSASNLAWNRTINAGQTVEFGFQGTASGAPEIPAVICK